MPPKKKSAKQADPAAATIVAEEPAASEKPPKAAPKKQSGSSATGKPRIFLIDTMSFIFRAYHAMARQRPMSTRTGIPTAATYVFINMLNKLREDFNPEYIAAVFDVTGPTFRDAQAKQITSVKKFDIKTQTFQETEYHGYKANRAEMPPDLAQQVPYIRRALDAYRIPILLSEGFEADDLIGTLARQAAEQGHPVYVVSSDKDMMQLVGDHVCVLNPTKDNLICDAAKVEEILGVPPSQVIDVMALRGDSIDNVPGAPGIGDKGSVELIKRFGSVENALDHADEVERKSYRESLQNNRDVVLLSKQLVTIDKFVPIELDISAMKAQAPDSDACRKLFTELEFTTLLKAVVPSGDADLGKTEYKELTSEAELKSLLAEAKKSGLTIAFGQGKAASPSDDSEEGESSEKRSAPQTGDLFANAPAPAQSLQIGLGAKSGIAFTADIHGSLSVTLKQALADASIKKTVHDSKAVTHLLREHGVELAGVEHDTQLYSYLLDSSYSNHTLANVALRKINVQLSGSLAQAADITLRLNSVLQQQIKEDEPGLLKLYEQIDLPVTAVLARMEQAGVKIDTAALSKLNASLSKEIDKRAKEIHELAGEDFNINSPKQLGEVLFVKMNLPKPVKYGKGKTISTAVDVLEELAETHDIARKVLDFRQVSKLKSTYVDTLPELIDSRTGRVHTTFNHTSTATGRLSSTNPNLQNIPIRTELGREIRAAFIAEEGNVLLAADYSQIELRLLAHFSGDPLLTKAFQAGDDIHQLTASEVFGVPPMMIDAEHRRRAKAVNFGIVYGLSPFGLSQQLGIDTREAKKYIDTYFERYAGVRKFIDRVLEETRGTSKVKTLFGRVRPIPDINSKNPNMRGFAERTAVNTPLQGTAADLIKLAMIRIDEELRSRKLKTRMTLQVHDELVFEVPKGEVDEVKQLVCDKMENVQPLNVPLVVDVGVGKNWRDLD